METLVGRWMEHCQSWGRVWFGTLFWGSVLGAAYLAAFPGSKPVSVYAATATFGAILGVTAKVRGRWV
jgi:hypothetical protein